MNKTSPLSLGLCMEGLEEGISQIITRVCDRFDAVTYLEIGVAEGRTLAGISEMIWERADNWRSIGIDLPNGYSLNSDLIRDRMRSGYLPLSFQNKGEPPLWKRVTIYLEDSHKLIPDLRFSPIHLALIDGCHGKDCAMSDFLNLETSIPAGGFVMFHDFGPDSTGLPQPHCKGGIDVFGACQELGLIDDKRAGWRFEATILGDKSLGGADMGVFERI